MRQCWKASDQRMNTVNELFQNIRFLKFYGWGALSRTAVIVEPFAYFIH